jgi:hypothetical protein
MPAQIVLNAARGAAPVCRLGNFLHLASQATRPGRLSRQHGTTLL